MRGLFLTALIVGLAMVVAAAAYLWYRHEETKPLPQKRGSSTIEFVPTVPVAKPRPERFVRNEPWPTYGYDAARTRFAPDFRLHPPYRTLWSFRTGNLIEFPPIVAYDRVIVLQQRGRLFSLDAATGHVAWKKHFRHCAASSPAAGSGRVYVALMAPYPCRRYPRTQSGLIAAIAARGGRILWTFRTGVVESSPLLVHGTLYFGSWDHHLYALDVHGKRPRLRWKFEADNEINSAPAFIGGRIFFGTDGGRVYSLDARTGRLIWRAESYSRFGRREYFYAAPALAYGRVFAANTDGNVYAFGATSGSLLWSSNAGSYVYSAPAVWRKTVYVGSYDGNFYAFDAATGERRWKFDAGASIHGAPSIINGLVYFSTCGTCGAHGSRHAALGPRATYALDARTGRLVWKFPMGHYSPVVADSKRIYVVGSTRVYALTERQNATHPATGAKKRRP